MNVVDDAGEARFWVLKNEHGDGRLEESIEE